MYGAEWYLIATLRATLVLSLDIRVTIGFMHFVYMLSCY